MLQNIDWDLIKSIIQIFVFIIGAVAGGGIIMKLKQYNKASKKNSGNINIGNNVKNVNISQNDSHNITQNNKSKKDGE